MRSLLVVVVLWSLLLPGTVFAAEADVAAGKAMFDGRCGQLCHQVPDPDQLTIGQWQRVLATMQKRMRQFGMPALSPQELEQLLAYLSQHARQ